MRDRDLPYLLGRPGLRALITSIRRRPNGIHTGGGSGYGGRMVPWPMLLCVLFGSQVMVVLLLVLGFALHRNRRRSKELLLAFMKSEVPLAIEVR